MSAYRQSGGGGCKIASLADDARCSRTARQSGVIGFDTWGVGFGLALERVTLPCPPQLFFVRCVVTGIRRQEPIQHRGQYPKRREQPDK